MSGLESNAYKGRIISRVKGLSGDWMYRRLLDACCFSSLLTYLWVRYVKKLDEFRLD